MKRIEKSLRLREVAGIFFVGRGKMIRWWKEEMLSFGESLGAGFGDSGEKIREVVGR